MLYGLAYRLLGSAQDAEDVLQEAYLRWLNVDRAEVAEPRRYLSRVVTRLALDQLRARQATAGSYVGSWLPEPVETAPPAGPAELAERRDEVSLATLHLMERLTPPERAVYVLRTAFGAPYAEIGDILDRSPADCRQLHHRATARMAEGRPRYTPSREEHERLLTGFIAAAREGDLARLESLLAADVVAYSDGGGRVRAARNPVVGAAKVARFFAGIYGPHRTPGRIRHAELNGQPAAVVDKNGDRYVLLLDVADGRIRDIFLVANPAKLTRVS
jgi:RNA polymerase sigma-70 factor (ECF subfamily)